MGTAPFSGRIDGCPLIGNAADGEKASQECQGERRGRAVDMNGLTGVVGDQLDRVGEGADLCFGGLKKDRKATRRGQNFAEVVT